MTKHYYLIRMLHTDALHKAGTQLVGADDTLHIGQTDCCEVQLPNSSQYEDALWAVIKKRDNGEGWNLIRTSPYKEHEVRVNGMPIGSVCRLCNDDHISFEGQRQELLFRERHDDHYVAGAVTMVHHGLPKGWIAALIVLPLLLFAVSFWFFGRQQAPQLTDEMLAEAQTSVFRLRVDSIQLVEITDHDTLVLGCCDYSAYGTAFLTTDSLLVTARHCVEPWLNSEVPQSRDTATIEPLPVRWALQAETYNQEIGSSRRLLISYCSLLASSGEEDVVCRLQSTDFVFDVSRDDIIELGDFDHQYFWRSISATPRRTDMMLGDVAWLRVTGQQMENPQGTIRRATKEEMAVWCSKANRPVTIIGFPKEQGVKVQRAERTADELKQALTYDADGYPETVLSHNGQLSVGYSGGPVLACDGNEWRVIGVVSVTDEENMNRTYAVPITEIDRYDDR